LPPVPKGQCLLDFVTHVVGYKAVLHKWANGDYGERRFTILCRFEIRANAIDAKCRLEALSEPVPSRACKTGFGVALILG
jgi:hypothetical protein